MNWFKKETQGFCVSAAIDQKNEYLVKEIQNLRAGLKAVEETINDLKLELWVYKTIVPKVEYCWLSRQRGPFHSYEKEAQELEAKGWHIKRVSDCGKYEIWMPLKKE